MHSDKRVNFSVGAHQKALLSRSETKVVKPIVVESGASCHMMADRDLFESLHDSHPRTITLGNGNKLLANKMGSVIIKPLQVVARSVLSSSILCCSYQK